MVARRTLARVHAAEAGHPIREIWLDDPGGHQRPAGHQAECAELHACLGTRRSHIAFALDHEGPRYGIFTIGIDGRGLRKVTPATGSDAFEPAWSPDGTRSRSRETASIVTVDRQGKETVLTDAANNDSSPAWRPVTSDEEGS